MIFGYSATHATRGYHPNEVWISTEQSEDFIHAVDIVCDEGAILIVLLLFSLDEFLINGLISFVSALAYFLTHVRFYGAIRFVYMRAHIEAAFFSERFQIVEIEP